MGIRCSSNSFNINSYITMIKQIKSNLTNIVVIIGLIGSIGAGFIKYGEVMTKLDVLTKASKTVDVSYASEIAVLEEKVAVLEAKKPVNVNEIKIQAKVNEAELKILKLEIEEIKENLKNPLN
jgi:type I site-specific restriction endonuclease